jgi:cytochrome c oxidase subunit 3
MILLTRGLTITLAHHSLTSGDKSGLTIGLLITIGLGAYFTIIQYVEYKERRYRVIDTSFGSGFFMATGAHGMHVMVGRVFIAVILIRSN